MSASLSEFLTLATPFFKGELVHKDRLAAVEKQNGEFQEQIVRLGNELEAAKQAVPGVEALAAANKTISTLQSEKAASATAIATLETAKTELQGKVVAAEKATSDLTAEIPKKVAAGVAEFAASQGLPAPLPVRPAAENPAKPDTKSELKGLAKVQAAFKAQRAGGRA